MSKVINIRGTSGSGKSTLVRRILDLYPTKTPNYVAGRKRPISITATGLGSPLSVPGHYDIPCGGCDTIGDVPTVYRLVGEAIALGVDVLYEGIMVAEAKAVHAVQVHEQADLTVILLTTPIEECLSAIAERRRERGARLGRDLGPLDPRNTVSRAGAHARGCDRLEAAGIRVLRLDRAAALATVQSILGIDLPAPILGPFSEAEAYCPQCGGPCLRRPRHNDGVNL